MFFYKLSGKKILDLFKKALFRRLTAIVAADAAELFQQFLLPQTEVDRRFHLKFHPQVAFVDRADLRHSLAFDFQPLAATLTSILCPSMPGMSTEPPSAAQAIDTGICTNKSAPCRL